MAPHPLDGLQMLVATINSQTNIISEINVKCLKAQKEVYKLKPNN